MRICVGEGWQAADQAVDLGERHGAWPGCSLEMPDQRVGFFGHVATIQRRRPRSLAHSARTDLSSPRLSSTNLARALASFICLGVLQFTVNSAGEATNTATHRALEVPTFNRLSE